MAARRQWESQRADMDDWEDFESHGVATVMEVAFQQALERLPPAPTPDRLLERLRPTATRAIRGTRRSLLRAGAPARLIAFSLGLRPTTAGELVGVSLEVAPSESDLLRQWADEGVSLITTAREEWLRDLPAQLVESARRGNRWSDIAKTATERAGVSRSRLRLIARDQTAKLNGRLTEHLHGKAGVTHYTWRTSRDGRVRDAHQPLDGQVYAWASGGAPGAGPGGALAHPGQAIQCRCTAEAVIPG
jgi:SPP1 gp7 family putative phage head morphogenesis protein